MSKNNNEAFGGIIIIGIAVFLWWSYPDSKERPEHVSMSPSSDSVLDVKYQEALNRISLYYRDEFLNALNDVQKGKIRRLRGETICKTFPSNEFIDWIGIIKKVSVSSDGTSVKSIDISIGENLYLDYNDTFGSGISEGPIYKNFIDGMNIGDKVEISGQIKYDHGKKANDCFYESSLTLSGGMRNPSYSVVFSKIQKTE